MPCWSRVPSGRRDDHLSTRLGGGERRRHYAGAVALRIRIDLSYDGTGFAGWAAQPGLRTVEGELSAALTTLLRPRRRAPRRGRADRRRGARTWPGGARRRRPAARGNGCAGARTGQPRTRPQPGCAASCPGTSPSGGCSGHLQVSTPASRRCVAAISTASGTTPASSIRCAATTPCSCAARWTSRRWTAAAQPARAARLRRLLQASRRRDDGPDPDVLRVVTRAGRQTIEVTVVADAFCHNMVRALVGSIVPVGDGTAGGGGAASGARRRPAGPPGAGHARPRTLASRRWSTRRTTSSPQRAEQARVRRTLPG